jgi:hypothetical protein
MPAYRLTGDRKFATFFLDWLFDRFRNRRIAGTDA